MRKAVFAGAVALAMVGSLFVSEHGIGPAPASAQEIVLTEGHIYRLKNALRLTAEQLQHWRPVESALRAAIRSSREDGSEASEGNEGWVKKVRTRVRGAVQVVALQRVASVAGPLISSLDETQKRNGMSVIRSTGVAALF